MKYEVNYVLRTKMGSGGKTIEVTTDKVFDNDEDLERYLTKTIANHENVPYLHIQVVTWD